MWRAARCIRPCDRTSSPVSVIPSPLIIRAYEASHRRYYSLLAEVESDSMESCKASEIL